MASRGMSGLGAVICSWEDEGGVTFSDLTRSNYWATKSMFFWIFRARRKQRSFGKKQSSDLDHSFNGLWKPRESSLCCPKPNLPPCATMVQHNLQEPAWNPHCLKSRRVANFHLATFARHLLLGKTWITGFHLDYRLPFMRSFAQVCDG